LFQADFIGVMMADEHAQHGFPLFDGFKFPDSKNIPIASGILLFFT